MPPATPVEIIPPAAPAGSSLPSGVSSAQIVVQSGWNLTNQAYILSEVVTNESSPSLRQPVVLTSAVETTFTLPVGTVMVAFIMPEANTAAVSFGSATSGDMWPLNKYGTSIVTVDTSVLTDRKLYLLADDDVTIELICV